MAKVTFALPFPEVSKLSQNSRLHWAPKSKLKRAARKLACDLTKEAFKNERVPEERPLPIRFTFYPPDKRVRDRDNCISALKHNCDGISDALGVDDALWEPTYAQGEVIKGGCVIVEVGRDE